MKTCKRCDQTKEETEFYQHRKECKACSIKQNLLNKNKRRDEYLAYQKQYHFEHGRQNRLKRTAWLDELKAAPCGDCLGIFPPECMDFDHIDPSTKTQNVSYMVAAGYSEDAVRSEMAKCRLICANCHRIRTAKQQCRRQL